MSSKKTISEKLQEQKEKFKKQALKELKLEIQKIFNEFPLLNSFRIVGFTPYFNDGDECHFGFREYLTKMNNICVGDLYSNPPRFSNYGDNEAEKKYIEDNLFWMIPCHQKIWKIFYGIGDEIFSDIFGTHVSVEYYKDKDQIIEDYTDHD